MYEQIDRWIERWIDEQIDKYMDVFIDGRMDGLTEAWMHGLFYSRRDSWFYLQMDA